MWIRVPLCRTLQGLALLALAGLCLPTVASAEVTCVARGVALSNPPPLVSTAVVRGSELLLAGGSSGLRRISLTSGDDIAQVPLDEPVPLYIASGPRGVAVSGINHRWSFLDESLNTTRELSHLKMDPLGSCLLLDDRIIVYGFARAEMTQTNAAWLFVQRFGGPPLPLAEYEHADQIAVRLARFHVRQITQGGVDDLAGGGWVAVDPLDYTVRVYDEHDRMVRGFAGRNPHFKKPDIAAYPHDRWGPEDRRPYFAWLQAQTQVKRPVALGRNLIGIVVGIPSNDQQQRHELDVYRVDGSIVAVGVPIPGLDARRLIVADAEPGRLVALTQATSWPFGAQATVWEIEITGLPQE